MKLSDQYRWIQEKLGIRKTKEGMDKIGSAHIKNAIIDGVLDDDTEPETKPDHEDEVSKGREDREA